MPSEWFWQASYRSRVLFVRTNGHLRAVLWVFFLIFFSCQVIFCLYRFQFLRIRKELTCNIWVGSWGSFCLSKSGGLPIERRVEALEWFSRLGVFSSSFDSSSGIEYLVGLLAQVGACFFFLCLPFPLLVGGMLCQVLKNFKKKWLGWGMALIKKSGWGREWLGGMALICFVV